MVRMFNAACPACGGKFHCHWDDLRHKDYHLLCPFCGHTFPQEESSLLEE